MKDKKEKLTPLSDLGEFGLIDHLTKAVKLKHPQSVLGVGDDAAILDYSGENVVVTTDILVEGIHFNLVYTPLKHLGYKSVVVNLSDILAMNGIPRQILVSVAISGKFSLEAIEELYDGIKLACEKYNIDLMGGDTSSSLTGLTISITAIGETRKEDVVYRSNAGNNDIICVSGNLGAAYMGLQLLEREYRLFKEDQTIKPELKGYEYILERQLKPEARIEIIEYFRKHKIKPTSMIDISDGLSSELFHISNKSKVGCRIYEEKIPIHENTRRMADELNIPALTAVLNGGEDYELLFTASVGDYDQIKLIPGVSVIGHITEIGNGNYLVMRSGNEVPLVAQGWNALQKKTNRGNSPE